MNKKTGVVVLNYKKYEDTLNCVNSLLVDNYSYTEIVIVDNGSGNESVDIFNELYSRKSNITIISLEKNIGYAKGNNVGIDYLRKKGIDSIFVANSDLIFPDSSIFEHMLMDLKNNDAVIVPTIKNPNGSYDQRVIYKKKYFFLRMAKELFKSVLKDIFGILSKANTDYYIPDCQSQETNSYDDCYVVSGSGFMLTRHFFDRYDGLFSETFLYGEECGTIILMNKAGLNSKVVNTDVIIHKGGASTPDNIKKMSRERKRINLNSDIKLLKLLLGAYKGSKPRNYRK